MDTNNYYRESVTPLPEEVEIVNGEVFEETKSTKEYRRGGFFKSLIKGIVFAAVFGVVAGFTLVGVTDYFGLNEEAESAGTTIIYKNDDDGLISAATNDSSEASVEKIVEDVMPAMVAITNTTETEYEGFFGTQTETYDSCGSGIIIGQDNEKLYIVTNNHVIEDADSLTVTFADNASVEASVKGTDSTMDLAVITVMKTDMDKSTIKSIKVAVMGDSDELKLGQPVIAIGNALGYGQTVTDGVVSALDRNVVIDNMTASLLQTNAAINPGNSGGALLNMNGEVIGINSAKYSDTDVEGVGFAIPIADAQPIIENLISKDMLAENERGYLGIYGVDVTEDVASVYELPIGAYISQLVNGGAAQKAGIKAGDVIIGFYGTEVRTMAQLQNLLQYCPIGEEVEVVVMTEAGEGYVEKTFKVKLQGDSSR